MLGFALFFAQLLAEGCAIVRRRAALVMNEPEEYKPKEYNPMPGSSEAEARKRARGDQTSKACASCSKEFLEDIGRAARERGESTDYFVFQAIWARYRMHQKLMGEDEGLKFLAFQKFLRHNHADPILKDALMAVIDRYLPKRAG
jgi:hypothetical protein